VSAEATGWTWKHSPYSGAQLLIHLAIADVVNDLHDYQFWMSTEQLARKARVSRSSVVATLSDMVKRGLLAVVEPGKTSRKPTVYQWTSATTALALARSDDVTSAIWPSPLARSPRTIQYRNQLNAGASEKSTAEQLRAELDYDREHAVRPPKRDKTKPLTALKGGP